MKKTLGIKSFGHTLIFLVGSSISLIFILIIAFGSLTFFETNNSTIYLILFSIAFISSGYLLFIDIKTPKIIIECDDNHLYLNFRTHMEKIDLLKITHVIPRPYRLKRASYSFGKVSVQTSNQSFTIGVVSNCKQVASRIMKKVKERQGLSDNSAYFNIDTSIVRD
jgi:cytochrome c biogenesis protein CcdA